MNPRGRSLSAEAWLDSGALTRIGRRVALRYGLTAAESEDLIQELMISVWRAGPDRLLNASWVFRAAEHRATDIKRANRRQPEIQRVDGSCDPDTGDPELIALLRAYVAGLSRRERRFCSLFLSGLSEREMARRLHLTRAAVRRTMNAVVAAGLPSNATKVAK